MHYALNSNRIAGIKVHAANVYDKRWCRLHCGGLETSHAKLLRSKVPK